MEGPGISRATLWVMSFGCAISVGNLYYVQPLLQQIAVDFHVNASQAGALSTLAQIGYGVGMLTLIPLGDSLERRRLILGSVLATIAMLLAMAFARSYFWLACASIAVGLASMTPQLLVPFAATLAKPRERGRVVGFVMSGLLIGILLARVFSGAVGQSLGWRSVYLFAAGISGILLIALAQFLPVSRPENQNLSYRKLIASLGTLFREERALRESAFYGGCLFGAFSVFWTTLAFLLAKPPFFLGSATAGAYGIVGIGGTLAASVVGRMTDRQSPKITILAGILFCLACFPMLWIFRTSLAGIAFGVFLLDIGVQACHISNQSRIFAVRPEARSRMNTVYMTCYFVGGSLGSLFGAWAWTRAGWAGVCVAGMVFSLLPLVPFAFTTRARELVKIAGGPEAPKAL